MTTAPTTRRPESNIGYRLRLVCNHMSAVFGRRLQNQGLTVADWIALSLVHESEPLSPGQLAKTLGMTPGAVSKMVRRLENAGRLNSQTSPFDRRAHLLQLTPAGAELSARLAVAADANDNAFFDCLTEEERAQLRTLLSKLVQAHSCQPAPDD